MKRWPSAPYDGWLLVAMLLSCVALTVSAVRALNGAML